ncbi:hypothetical protein HK102_012591 [Quaeritorhiza haematococci]|nr:hypothetical protein HK102_012591 [Quaeritorhiza haematococci]
MTAPSLVALVTGANKGIGRAICHELAVQFNSIRPSSPYYANDGHSPKRSLTVILAARDESRGQRALEELRADLQSVKALKPQGVCELEFKQLDINDEKSIDQAVEYVRERHNGLDFLINNAGIAAKGDAFDIEVVTTTLKTNYFATVKIRDKFLQDDIKLENVTNLMNQFIEDVRNDRYHQNGWPKMAYGTSKAGLTAATRALARWDATVREKNLFLASCCPGWVRTDMAGPKAPLTTTQGAQTPVWVALYADEQKLPPNAFGGFFNDMGFRSEDLVSPRIVTKGRMIQDVV